jgi:hypothetical protein
VRAGPLREQFAADLGDLVACAVPLWRGPLLGGHDGPRAVDQFRLDGRAADVDGERESVVVVHESRMMERVRLRATMVDIVPASG